MFTIDQIRQTHAKVKSGADFPKYVQELKRLGVVYYDNYVADGHTIYYGLNDFKIPGDAKYAVMMISDTSFKEKLGYALNVHQQGHTDYPTFCKHAAEAGVEKWTVHIMKMTCTYYNKSGDALVTEEIPVPE